MTRSKLLILLALAALAGAVALMPAPAGLSRSAQTVLAVTVFTAGLWLFQVFNNAVSTVLMMGLLVAVGVAPALALSGFSSPGFWILLVVLFYGFAMQRTGLAQRISFYVLSLFPATYPGILSAFFFIGAALALGIPSMTVRTAIMLPIAWALTQALNLEPRSRGTALIVLTTVEMAVVPGCGLLYGSLFGPVVESVFRSRDLPLSWLAYAGVIGPPTLLLCALIIAGNLLALRPQTPLAASRDFIRGKLKELGPVQRAEWITAVVVAASIVFWATDQWHHLPSFLAGMFALPVFAAAGIVRDQDIAGGVSWTLLIFLGGIFGLANVIQQYKVTDWVAGYAVPAARGLADNPLLLVMALALAMYLLRFLDPSGFIALPVLFLPVSDVTLAAGIPSLVLMAPLVLAAVPFWATYQNFWIAMGEGATGGQAFTARQRLLLASVYGVAVLAALAVGVGYWKLAGIL